MSMSRKSLLNAVAVGAVILGSPSLAEEKTEPKLAATEPAPVPEAGMPKSNPFVPPTIGLTPAATANSKAPGSQQVGTSTSIHRADERIWGALQHIGTINGNEIFSFNDQCYVTVQKDKFVDDQCYRSALRRMLNSSDKP